MLEGFLLNLFPSSGVYWLDQGVGELRNAKLNAKPPKKQTITPTVLLLPRYRYTLREPRIFPDISTHSFKQGRVEVIREHPLACFLCCPSLSCIACLSLLSTKYPSLSTTLSNSHTIARYKISSVGPVKIYIFPFALPALMSFCLFLIYLSLSSIPLVLISTKPVIGFFD